MKNQKGYLIVEVLISIVIFAMVVLSLFSSISFVFIRTEKSKYDSEAMGLVQEGIEVSYNVLLNDWTSYADGTYFPAINATKHQWLLLPGENEKIRAKYTRTVEVKSACREIGSGNILPVPVLGICPGEYDTKSKIIKSTVSWEESGEMKEASADLLIFNL
jgi:hypothetical protein